MKEKETDILEQEKKAVAEIIAIKPITRDNAIFQRTEGGFVSLDYGERHYPRVAVHRCFPFSDPSRYISIREPDNDGREIGLILDLKDLPEETQSILEEQMALRYFTPHILQIRDIKEEYGYS